VSNDERLTLSNHFATKELVDIEIEDVVSFYGKVDDKKFLLDVEKVKFKVSQT
jgi:hypothetical protein